VKGQGIGKKTKGEQTNLLPHSLLTNGERRKVESVDYPEG